MCLLMFVEDLSFYLEFWGLGWLVAALISYFIIPKFGFGILPFLMWRSSTYLFFSDLEKSPWSIPYFGLIVAIEEAQH